MIRKLSFIFIVLSFFNSSFAQDKTKAMELMTRAMAKLESPSYAIMYEGIAFGCNNPLDYFKLPAYKVYKGGYFYFKDDKYEIRQGHIKGICDGNIYAFINEQEKVILLDSVRDYKALSKEEINYEKELSNIMGFDLADSEFYYIGTEVLKGTTYHKIKSKALGNEGYYSIYYITMKDNRLFMYADFNGKNFDVFEVKTIKDVPEKHQFTLDIPKKRLTELYGFKVMDMRFTRVPGK